MEIASLHRTVISPVSAKATFINVDEVDKIINEDIHKTAGEKAIKSIRDLVDNNIIYQNPVLFAAMQDNVPTGMKEFQPDVRAEYKVNPVRAIYDSNKAHD